MSSVYKLTYFPIQALAEPARMLMKYGGIEFVDDRFERDDWPYLKKNMPWGQVPVFTANGKKYHQSIAISRFLAKQVKLVGEDDWENLEIDMMVDTINDLRQKIGNYHYEQDPDMKAFKKKHLFNELVPDYLKRLDEVVAENDGHFALKKLTWADIFYVGLLHYMNFMMGSDFTAKYPNLQAVKNNVLEIPAIKEWVATRPKSDM